MSDTIIKVDRLGKRYSLGQVHTNLLSERIGIGLQSFFGKFRRRGISHFTDNVPKGKDFWALKDVSFEVKQGEVVGIIGRNGAGKSTLLKILSRITTPTEGRAEIYGRVGSLLEVGTGFHPELTGRENIFLNGTILGMSRAEIKKNFDEIVAFAEVEKFIDTPVKRYSSGMYVRLAFAVAAHLEPEILIVDEVLAVGDAAFQKKCLWKMGEVAKEGRTVLFVSHNMGAILSLSNEAILLHEGKILDSGNVSSVIDKYIGVRLSQEDSVNLKAIKRTDSYRAGAVLKEVRLLSRDKISSWQLPFGGNIILDVEISVFKYMTWLELSVALKTVNAFEIASTLSHNYLPKIPLNCGKHSFRLTYHDMFLTPGMYRFGLGLRSEWGVEDYLSEAVDLEVVVSEKSAEMNVHKVFGALIPQVTLEVN
jgi:lipopolysaccharide transport system ATP-binding protein